MSQLNPKQLRFVDEYLIDLNGTQAAIRAGYSQKTANEQAARLLANVSLQAAIQEKMQERSKRTEITADYVLNTIVETIERCKQEIEPIYAGRGENREFTGEFQFDSMAVLKGAELLGKHLKLFTDKVEHGGPNGGPIKTEHTLDTENLTTDQLRALANIRLKT
jgi:phage terminase small subunit